MKGKSGLLWLIGLVVLVTLACAQSGEILSPEEATAAAKEAEEGPREVTGGNIVTEGPQIGQAAVLIGKGVIVNFFNSPGGKISGGAGRDSKITILDLAEYEGELWYLVNSSAGDGWVRQNNIEAVAGEDGTGQVAEGPLPGDTVYITGVKYLINLFAKPGGFISAGQEKGTPATLLEVSSFEGEPWYLVDAPTGEGWLPAENISTEAP